MPRKSVFHCIDAHTCGNPVRLVYSGGPELEGGSMLDRQQHFIAEYDWIRTSLMFEPRGHADMYGAVMTEPVTDDGDLGVLFLHNEGYSTMCGHGIIGLVTAGLECELFETREPGIVRIDSPVATATSRLLGS